MADLSTLQTRLEALRAARDTGALTVKHGEEMITYRSLDEINRIIASLEAQIDALGTTRRAVSYVHQSDKGL